jgi:serine protease Do
MRIGITVCCVSVLFLATANSQERAEKVRRDKEQIEKAGQWIYNDLAAGLKQAKSSGKPVLVVLRCIPCEACHEFDERVASFDPELADVMDRFVRVRIVRNNGIDLRRFQFDYDQSWAVFVLHADGTVLARYGTRADHDDAERDISVAGFRRALEGALELHADYPAIRASLAGKQGRPTEFRTPEAFPSLSEYRPGTERSKDPVQGCIHCHQLREAERLVLREAGEPWPEPVLFPYPMPDLLGLTFDPERRAVVREVQPESPAADGGFRVGDELLRLAGQPVVSIADVQWVLHTAGASDGAESTRIAAAVRRDNRELELALSLPAGWRRNADLSWRPTTWDLRRMATGGLVLADADDEFRRSLDIPADRMALRIKHIGQYGAHAAAKNAGFLPEDVLVAFDGHTDRWTETQIIAHAIEKHNVGDRVKVVVLRDGRRVELELPQQ